MSEQDNKINNLHKYLKDELDKVVIVKYPDFNVIDEFECEEGLFILIKGGKNLERIIGIVPINSNSIYSNNEIFKIEDFTNKTTHFIHKKLISSMGFSPQRKLIITKKPIIVCDEQGGVLFFHKNWHYPEFISKCKSIILDDYDIDYNSFYHVAKSEGVNDTYKELTDENKVNEFIHNILSS